MVEKVSIIVPVYNAEKKLERCVASLLGQTWDNLEILLVNDGSRDNSLELCHRLAREDCRIRVIDKPNGGVSSARNAGLDAATGAFVLFCDSDDWVDSHWCEALVENYLPEHLTVCDFYWDEVPAETGSGPVETVKKQDYLHRQKLMCSPWNKLFYRSVLEENRLRFPEALSLGEDFVFCLHYLCAISGDVRYVYRQLYHYDTSEGDSLSRRAPTISQCQAFYQQVSEAMDCLGAIDPESLRIRSELIGPHFERYLKGVAGSGDLSSRQKLRAASAVEDMEGFRATCAQGIRWGNPVYLRWMQQGHARLGMLYLLAVLRIKKRI